MHYIAHTVGEHSSTAEATQHQLVFILPLVIMVVLIVGAFALVVRADKSKDKGREEE